MQRPANRLGTPAWRSALDHAWRGSDTASLVSAVGSTAALDARERKELLGSALALAEARGDLAVLIALLGVDAGTPSRAEVLAVVLGVASELDPGFVDLMAVLRGGERMLVLGALIEASRLDPDPERRLLRLKRLVQVVPPDSRGLYWSEAESLAEQGGDDAQLTLLGLARELPEGSTALTSATLRRAVHRVDHAFKRAMAYIALAELTDLNAADLREAGRSGAGVPDDTLRILTLMRISQLEGGGTG